YSALAYYNRGNAWAEKGEHDKAITDFSRFIELKPKVFDGFLARGIAWGTRGEYDKAIADYSRAIELKSKYSALAYYNRGNVWEAKGDHDKAIADYTEAIKLNPVWDSPYNSRGDVWRDKGDYDKAIADYNKTIELNPKSASAYGLRGRTYFGCGKFADAAKDLHRFLVLDPHDKYHALWRYLARRRAGQPAGKELAAFASRYVKDSSAWPGPVFELLAGRIEPAKCLQAAEPKKPDLTAPKLSAADKTARKTAYEKLRREQLCEAYFYIAQ
ncbi:unnamed protein product, partial [marine sediment metagenome]